MINLGRGWPDPSLLPPLQSLLSLSQLEIQQQQNQALQYGADAGNLDMLQAIVQLRKQCRSANADYEDEGDSSSNDQVIAAGEHHESINKSISPSITPENLIITNGSSQGLDMVCLRFSQPGDIILVEPLSYFYVEKTLEQRGLIPMQAPSFPISPPTTPSTPAEQSTLHRTTLLEESRGNLIDLDALEQALESRQAKGLDMPKLLYTVPICHNPTGTTMEEDEAKKLIRIARKYRFKIISDEVYMFLAFNCETVPKSLVDYELELLAKEEDEPPPTDGDSSFAVLALNSFSKILGPGLRLGWIESCPYNIKVLQGSGAVVSGGGLNPLGCSIVGAYIRSGQQDRLIQTLNVSYRARCKVMMDALELNLGALPVTVEQILQPNIKHPCYVRVTGGFFLWLRFPNHWNLDTKELLQVCLDKQTSKGEDESVSFFAGCRFSLGVPLVGDDKTANVVPDVANHSIRVCFAYLQEEEIAKGISYLAKTAHDILYSNK